jgi:hypothetical protein
VHAGGTQGSQSVRAALAQSSSHAQMQQLGSTAQICSQHAASEHPGVWLGAQQSLPFGVPQRSSHVVHSWSACDAQAKSHDELQQN